MTRRSAFIPLEIKIPEKENGRFLTGFTLIELLVVIAIIALLMGVLMPALMRAKEAGKTIKCQANLRTLTTAWYTYAMDNDDKLCGSWNYNASICRSAYRSNNSPGYRVSFIGFRLARTKN